MAKQEHTYTQYESEFLTNYLYGLSLFGYIFGYIQSISIIPIVKF